MSFITRGIPASRSSAIGNSHWQDIATELRPLTTDEPRHTGQKQASWLTRSLSPEASSDAITASLLRPVMVAVLTVLCSMNMISLTASKRVAGKFEFEYVTVTLMQELSKFCIACIALQVELAYCVPSHERPGYRQYIYDNLLKSAKCLQYGIPGLIYCFDNNFQYVILQFLQPAELAILWNFKIFATALLLHTFLNRRYTQQQWIAMAMLVLGCAWTQGSDFLSQHREAAHALHPAPFSGGSAAGSPETLSTGASAKLIGAGLAVIGSSVAASGNVVCEWLVKKGTQESLHVQNMQLYAFGILFNLTTLIVKAASEPNSPIHGSSGFFTGYNRWVWTVILVGSCSGIAVSVTLKFVDNIAVIFSHALSMIIVAVISAQFFGLQLSAAFVGGGTLVLVSLYMFYSESGSGSTKRYSNGYSNGERELAARTLLGVDRHGYRSSEQAQAVPMYCLEGTRI